MIPRPPRSTRTDTLFPYTTLFRSRGKTLMARFEVAPVSREVLTGAMERGFDDYEDAVLHEAALLSGAVAIVARNGKAFAKATLPVFEPVALRAAMAGMRGGTILGKD